MPRVSDVLGQYNWPVVRQSVVVASASAGSASAPSAPPTSAAPASTLVTAAHPRGAVVTLRVPDSRVGFSARQVLVYLPPQYFADATARFPVVYLLHGSPGIPVDLAAGR
jgi:enterochelin esterase-like enzyme